MASQAAVRRGRPHGPRTTPYSNKTQPYPCGVTRNVFQPPGENRYVRFLAAWTENKKPRLRTFYVGREEYATEADERQALRAATAFRRAYEAHALHDAPFDPHDWDNWRDVYA